MVTWNFLRFCIRQASSIKLPMDNLAAEWSKLCDSTFANLQAVVSKEVEDEKLLPHVSAVLSRVAFENSIQGAYRHGD